MVRIEIYSSNDPKSAVECRFRFFVPGTLALISNVDLKPKIYLCECFGYTQ